MNVRRSASLLLLAVASTASASPLSGGALSLVNRLARAGSVPLNNIRMAETQATLNVAHAFNARNYCLTDPTLTRLQREPTNMGVQAMVFLEFRCVKRVQGQALTPALSLALLRNMGYALRGPDLLLALLDNPPPGNALTEAAQIAVTPLTPRN